MSTSESLTTCVTVTPVGSASSRAITVPVVNPLPKIRMVADCPNVIACGRHVEYAPFGFAGSHFAMGGVVVDVANGGCALATPPLVTVNPETCGTRKFPLGFRLKYVSVPLPAFAAITNFVFGLYARPP